MERKKSREAAADNLFVRQSNSVCSAVAQKCRMQLQNNCSLLPVKLMSSKIASSVLSDEAA